MEPKGWKFFNDKQLKDAKLKLLNQYDLSNMEIDNFMNSMSNSRNVNDIIRKIGAKGSLEDFLRYKIPKKTQSQQMIDNMKRGKF